MTLKNYLKNWFQNETNTKCKYGEIIGFFYQNVASISSIAYSKKIFFFFAFSV